MSTDKVGGWQLAKALDNRGKSATVYVGTKDGLNAAVKVFNRDLVDRYGREVQLERIRRELSLVGHTHPNLVKIYEGGECLETGDLYVAMELLDGFTLSTVAGQIPRDRIRPLISQVASAARYLEGLGIAHRDIKPANIILSKDYMRATLLDLGVLRPVGVGGMTDASRRYFVGTLQYSSPEFLLRTEEDTTEGWRAVTFYQLGAVLHDLIMGRPIFDAVSEPFARLAKAVEYDIPVINAPDVGPDLTSLARNCLQKDPALRLKFVRWEDFEERSRSASVVEILRERIGDRVSAAQQQGQVRRQPQVARSRALRERSDLISREIAEIIRQECIGGGLFPPIKISTHSITDDTSELSVFIPKSPDHQLTTNVNIWLGLTVLDEMSNAAEIVGAAIISNGTHEPTAFRANARPLLVGVFDPSMVRSKLQELLYQSLDQAQEAAVSSDGEISKWVTTVEEAADE